MSEKIAVLVEDRKNKVTEIMDVDRAFFLFRSTAMVKDLRKQDFIFCLAHDEAILSGNYYFEEASTSCKGVIHNIQ